jgi:hypothetical protein
MLSVLVHKAVLTWIGALIICIIYMGKVNVLMCVNFIIPSCLDWRNSWSNKHTLHPSTVYLKILMGRDHQSRLLPVHVDCFPNNTDSANNPSKWPLREILESKWTIWSAKVAKWVGSQVSSECQVPSYGTPTRPISLMHTHYCTELTL